VHVRSILVSFIRGDHIDLLYCLTLLICGARGGGAREEHPSEFYKRRSVFLKICGAGGEAHVRSTLVNFIRGILSH
jgi:hypothetical protein